MKFTDLKISLEKSWKFTPQVLILIILGIFVNLVFSVSIWYSLKTISPSPPAPIETPSKIPTENLFGVNAEIVEINLQEKTMKVKSFIPQDWNKEWLLVISESTVLTTDSSWQESELTLLLIQSEEDLTSEKQAEREERARQLLKILALEDFKAGDIIYVTADDDFAQNYKIEKVKTVRLFE